MWYNKKLKIEYFLGQNEPGAIGAKSNRDSDSEAFILGYENEALPFLMLIAGIFLSILLILAEIANFNVKLVKALS